jgi:hypothetical protein
MTSSASLVAGVPAHVARKAAQAGTATGLGKGVGDGLGDGIGDGLGSGVGIGVGLKEGECEGLERATTGPFAVQPVKASSTPASANPLLTGDATSLGGRTLRDFFRCKAPRISLTELAQGASGRNLMKASSQ